MCCAFKEKEHSTLVDVLLIHDFADSEQDFFDEIIFESLTEKKPHRGKPRIAREKELSPPFLTDVRGVRSPQTSATSLL